MIFISGSYCNSTWDTFLCWPPTPANTIVKQPCPSANGLDVSSKYKTDCQFYSCKQYTLKFASIFSTTNQTKHVNWKSFNSSTILKLAYQCAILLCESLLINLMKTMWKMKEKKTVKLCINSWRGGEQAYMRKEADYSK